MRQLSDLFDDDVEHRPLGDVAGYSTTRARAAELNEANFVGVDNLLSDRQGRVDSSHGPNSTTVSAFEPGDVLIGNIRPYLRKIWLADREGGCSGDVLVIRINESDRTDLSPAFLYHVLATEHFFAFNMRHAKGAKMPRGDKKALLKYAVPLPPLATQQRLVRLIDEYLALQDGLLIELRSELSARALQHAFHRSALLAFDEERDTSQRLGDLVDFTNGKAHEKFVTPDGDIALMTSRFISTGGASARRVPHEAVLTPACIDDVALVMSDLPKGRALARTFHVQADDRFAANQRVCLLRSTDETRLMPRFLYHVLNRNPQLLAHDTSMDQTHLKKSHILDVRIAVPDVAEQQRVVSALDLFDELFRDLAAALNNEISGRRQQAEYVRWRLVAVVNPGDQQIEAAA